MNKILSNLNLTKIMINPKIFYLKNSNWVKVIMTRATWRFVLKWGVIK